MTQKLYTNSYLGPHPKYASSVQAGIPRIVPKAGWQRVKIGDLLREVKRPIKMKDDQLYNLVTVRRSRAGVIKREDLLGKDIAVKSQFLVKEGDFLISKRQIVHGACGFVPKELDGSIVSNEYSVLNCKNIVLPQFLNFLMYTTYFQQTCFHSSIGVHVEKMIFKLEDWLQWKIEIPSLAEQQKIASFLGAVDEKLNKLRRKKELLETYKRGLMQKIFSQELRFTREDGSAFPEWEEKRLGELGDFQSGVGFSESEQGGKFGIPFYKVSDMNRIGNERVMTSANNYVTNQQIQKLKFRPIIKPSYIFAKVGAAIFLERKRKAENFLLDNNMMAFTPNSLITVDFASAILNKIRLSRYAQVGALPSYNASDLRTLRTNIPTKKEQQKIADFLSTIDHKIEAVGEQISKIDTFKKGLLQKMFV